MAPLDLAVTVHTHRRATGLSQQALARLAGVGKTVIFDIEKGKMTVQLDTLLKVFAVLNIQIKLVTPLTSKQGSNT